MNYYPELLWIIINIFITLFIQNLSCELLSFISSCGFLQCVWGVWWHVWSQRLLPCGILSPPGFSAAVVIASVALQVCTTESLCFALGAFSKAEWLFSPQVGTTLKNVSMGRLMPLGATLHQWYGSQRVNSLASLAFGGMLLRNYDAYGVFAGLQQDWVLCSSPR